MNLCPIIVAGMIPCFPFLSVGGGRWCYIASFAACPCVGLERWLLKAISFLIIRESIQLSLKCSVLRTVKTAPPALLKRSSTSITSPAADLETLVPDSNMYSTFAIRVAGENQGGLQLGCR